MQLNESAIKKMISDPALRKEGFEMIVREYSEMLYHHIRRMVLTHEDANDVLQNTFLKAWQGLAKFEGRSKLSSWLYRIAVNESLTFLRSRNHDAEVTAIDDDEGVANMLLADEYFDGDKTEIMFLQALEKLPPAQRTVFCMHYYDEMKYSEISAILGTSEGALKANYHLAVQKISEFFKSND